MWLRLICLVIGLKDSRQFFNQWEVKPKSIAPRTRDFSRASSELQVIAMNGDWFTALFVRVVIGRSNCFGFGFSTVTWKPLYGERSLRSWRWKRQPFVRAIAENLTLKTSAPVCNLLAVEIWPSSIPLMPNFPAVNSRDQPVSSKFADFASAPPVEKSPRKRQRTLDIDTLSFSRI